MLPILIGGSPCAGKSTLTKALAADRGITFASVDDLREQFQKEMESERDHYPWLFSSHGITAEEFWKDRRPADLVRMEIEQASEYWPTMKKIISTGRYGILEGVSILPELLWRDFGENIQAVFLIDPDRERVRQTILTRGLWGAADTYADWIKPLEIEWVMLHNEWFREQARKYPYPLMEVGDRDKVFHEVEKLLNQDRRHE